MNLKKSFSINAAIEALEGKSFTKSTANGKTIFSVEDSPIKTLEVSNKGFVIHINPEKVYFYK